ncbi:MAG: glycosyl hydrolase [bacterium]|nr:glycosyl hydrolase [bacterium]
MYHEFTAPGAQWRGKPFWSWNGALRKDELLRQIHVMQEMGFGGYFMHSRVGLVTEYLGDEWFELINACADEGARLGMEPWLYDEDRWPSGSVGGAATRDPRNRQKFLYLEISTPAAYVPKDEHLALFTCVLKNTYDCYHARRVSAAELAGAPADTTLLVFGVHEQDAHTFYNGFTYLDTLNADATRAFIALTHEQYARHCDGRLGTTIKGIFTDEPTYGPIFNNLVPVNSRPEWQCAWTPALPGEFARRYGTDLLEQLPALFLQPEGQRVALVKWQYFELVQELFLEHYAQPCLDWCRQHRLLLTGHVLDECTLLTQAAACGSTLRYYERMDYPGMDLLTEGNRGYWIAMQVASAARQTGKAFTLSELYGCTGWQFNFQGHKAVGDWQVLLGINLRCHHLSWYTMAGEAKRDYPGSILHQSAWWRHYNVVETYFARMGYLLSQGEPCRDVLVLHPLESVWCQARVVLTQEDPAVKDLETKFATLNQWLLENQVGFDYGDEDMLARLHAVRTDATGTPILALGHATYRVVVVSGMVTVRATTLAVLAKFIDAGGVVVFHGPAPAHVDAGASPAAQALAARAVSVPYEAAALVACCRAGVAQAVLVRHADTGAPVAQVFQHLRRDGDGFILALLNTDRAACGPVEVVVRGVCGAAEEWDCLTGEHYRADGAMQQNELHLHTTFAPAGSRVFIIRPAARAALAARTVWQETRRSMPAGPFACTLTEPNVAVLDHARWRIDDGAWQAPTDVLKIDHAVRGHFGLGCRGGNALQPWFKLKYQRDAALQPRGDVTLAFEFDILSLPAAELTLAMESPRAFAVTVNEHPLTFPAVPAPWIDVAFETAVILRAALCKGKNVIILRTAYTDMTDLEALYLLGAMGVVVAGQHVALTAVPATLTPQCITTQGLPFYSGAVRYQVPVATHLAADEHLFLTVPAHEGALLNVYDGATRVATVPWAPYEADVTDAVRRGARTLDLEVVLTRRNTFGPFHEVHNSGFCGPGSFVTCGDNYTDAYLLHPAGLLQPPVLSVRRCTNTPLVTPP